MRHIRNQWELGRAGEDFFWHFGGLRDEVEMIAKYTTKAEQETRGDFSVHVDGVIKNVDVKVELVRSPNFVIELVQDANTDDPGWFTKLTDCHEIWTAQANLDELAPFGLAFWSIWRVSLPRLRYTYSRHGDKWKAYETKHGWGYTQGKRVPYATLLAHDVAILWWGWHYTGAFFRPKASWNNTTA